MGHQPDVAPIYRADAKDLRSSSKLKLGQVGLGWPASTAVVCCAAAGLSATFRAQQTYAHHPRCLAMRRRSLILLLAALACPAGGGRLPPGRQDVRGHPPRPARRGGGCLCAHGVLQSEGAVWQVGGAQAPGFSARPTQPLCRQQGQRFAARPLRTAPASPTHDPAPPSHPHHHMRAGWACSRCPTWLVCLPAWPSARAVPSLCQKRSSCRRPTTPGAPRGAALCVVTLREVCMVVLLGLPCPAASLACEGTNTNCSSTPLNYPPTRLPVLPALRRTAEAIADFVTERSGLPVGKIERTPLISAR